MRRRLLLHVLELVHQLGVDVEPAGGVEDHDVAAGLRRLGDAARADLGRAAALLGVDGHVHLRADHLQLLDRRGPLDVGRDEERLLRLLLAQVEAELRAGGRLARALEADHHHDGRTAVVPADLLVLAAAEQRDHLVVDDLDELVARRDAREARQPDRLLPDARDERVDHLERDVRLEERRPDLADPFLDVGFGQPSAGEAGEEPAESLGERVEHVGSGVSSRTGPAGPARFAGPWTGTKTAVRREWSIRSIRPPRIWQRRSTRRSGTTTCRGSRLPAPASGRNG